MGFLDMREWMTRLEKEGVKKFADSFDELLEEIKSKGRQASSNSCT